MFDLEAEWEGKYRPLKKKKKHEYSFGVLSCDDAVTYSVDLDCEDVLNAGGICFKTIASFSPLPVPLLGTVVAASAVISLGCDLLVHFHAPDQNQSALLNALKPTNQASHVAM